MTNEAIERGDLVRIVEDANIGDDFNLIYMQDIQAIHRVTYASNDGDEYSGVVVVETLRGTYGLSADAVYLVDVDALHGEMEEMMAEEAIEGIYGRLRLSPEYADYLQQTHGGTLPEDAVLTVPQPDTNKKRAALAREYEDYRDNAKSLKLAVMGFTDWLEVLLLESRQATVKVATERDARIAELEAALTPFALAAEDDDAKRVFNGDPAYSPYLYLHSVDTGRAALCTSKDAFRNVFLSAYHLRAAAEAMKNADALTNAPDDSA